MTPAAAEQYRDLMVHSLRQRRRDAQLIEEYAYIKDFKLELTRNDGMKCNSFSLEELFEMYDLTKDQREYRA
jgi:hypothetical protein